ncbi:class II aldolase/adducin family protein [Streptomyces sp. NBC_01230]|uniref:class II aldolase/adducin family protein n=1 Tax=Streptomyces sp. NBC_01230 TaxID=2903784 RepID=UPI003FA3A4D4
MLFGRFGFSEGVAGHITVRDPENPDRFRVDPFGMCFNQITASDLILVDHEGTLLHDNRVVNKAGHRLRPGAVRPTRPVVRRTQQAGRRDRVDRSDPVRQLRARSCSDECTVTAVSPT